MRGIKRPGAKGEGLTFYGPEEVIIAYDEKVIDMHAEINVRVPVDKQDASKGEHIVQTTAGPAFAESKKKWHETADRLQKTEPPYNGN